MRTITTTPMIGAAAPSARALALAMLALCALLPLLLASGCVSEKPARKVPARSVSGGGDKIQEINVLALPVALNLDATPGPDGFGIKVYAGNRSRPKPFPIDSGKIEILMFDGIPGVTEGASNQPRRTWVYTAEQLRPLQVDSSIGVCYQLALPWGDAKPVHDRIAVVVRYIPPKGPSINSAPSVIAAR